jgi:hypothetical protein
LIHMREVIFFSLYWNVEKDQNCIIDDQLWHYYLECKNGDLQWV